MDAGTISWIAVYATWIAAYASVLIALFILIRQRKRLAERMREAHSELIAEMREANGQLIAEMREANGQLIAEMREANGELSGANSGVEGRDTPPFEPRL